VAAAAGLTNQVIVSSLPAAAALDQDPGRKLWEKGIGGAAAAAAADNPPPDANVARSQSANLDGTAQQSWGRACPVAQPRAAERSQENGGEEEIQRKFRGNWREMDPGFGHLLGSSARIEQTYFHFANAKAKANGNANAKVNGNLAKSKPMAMAGGIFWLLVSILFWLMPGRWD
jgi:hypothetical protein